MQETPEYQKLTQKQRLFVATYCQGGILNGQYDPIEATRTAYQCKTPEIARVMSYSLMTNIRIVAALNRHFNTEPIEEFITLLDRAIRNKKLTTAQLRALELKADILGFRARLPGTRYIPLGTVPKDVQEASKQARKEKRKKYERKPPEPEVQVESPFGFKA